MKVKKKNIFFIILIFVIIAIIIFLIVRYLKNRNTSSSSSVVTPRIIVPVTPEPVTQKKCDTSYKITMQNIIDPTNKYDIILLENGCWDPLKLTSEIKTGFYTTNNFTIESDPTINVPLKKAIGGDPAHLIYFELVGNLTCGFSPPLVDKSFTPLTDAPFSFFDITNNKIFCIYSPNDITTIPLYVLDNDLNNLQRYLISRTGLTISAIPDNYLSANYYLTQPNPNNSSDTSILKYEGCLIIGPKVIKICDPNSPINTLTLYDINGNVIKDSQSIYEQFSEQPTPPRCSPNSPNTTFFDDGQNYWILNYASLAETFLLKLNKVPGTLGDYALTYSKPNGNTVTFSTLSKPNDKYGNVAMVIGDRMTFSFINYPDNAQFSFDRVNNLYKYKNEANGVTITSCSCYPGCIPPCVGNCDGKYCGDNGCGGSCGPCAAPNICTNGICISNNPPEVFGTGDGYKYTKSQAESICSKYNTKVATKQQLIDAQKNGAQWCSFGWVANSDEACFPSQPGTNIGCGNGDNNVQYWTPSSGLAAVNCYGNKPTGMRRFNELNDKYFQTSNCTGIYCGQSDGYGGKCPNTLITTVNTNQKWTFIFVNGKKNSNLQCYPAGNGYFKVDFSGGGSVNLTKTTTNNDIQVYNSGPDDISGILNGDIFTFNNDSNIYTNKRNPNIKIFPDICNSM